MFLVPFLVESKAQCYGGVPAKVPSYSEAEHSTNLADETGESIKAHSRSGLC